VTCASHARSAACWSLWAAILTLLAPPLRSEQAPNFPAHVEVVRTEVVVLDKTGKPVTGLRAEDFEVKEDGKVRPVVSFEPVVVREPAPAPEAARPAEVTRSQSPDIEEGRYLLIFFDDVHIGPVNSEFVRQSLRNFLEHDVRDGDWVTIVAPLSGVWWTARTAWEHQQLPEIVGRLNGRLTRSESRGAYDAMNKIERPSWNNPLGGGMHEMEPLSLESIGSSVSTEALYATVKRLISTSLAPLQRAVEALSGFRGHKSLIFYSQGFILAPGVPDFERVIELARRRQIAVNFVDAAGLRSGSIRDGMEAPDPSTPYCTPLLCFETEEAGAARIAHETGGRAVATNDFAAPMREALDRSMAYYLVGYEPVAGKPKEHHVSIHVRRQGLTVQARTRYSPGPDQPADPPVVRALHAVFDATDLPIRVGAFFGAVAKEEVETTLAVDAAPSTEVAKRLKLAVELRPRDGKKVLGAESEISLGSGAAVIRAALAPGIWQARVVVRDPESGKTGSALHTFEVPAASAFRLSTPVITDTLEPDGSPRIELEPTFASSATLHCRYEVFGATPDKSGGTPHVTHTFSLEAGGKTINHADSTEVGNHDDKGRILGAYDVALSALRPGTYSLAIHVGDEVAGQTRDEHRSVRIVAP
jgi:VWFA-related protein